MSTLAFDTHSFVKRLTEAGMPEPQAEVLSSEQARLLEYQLATKQDTAEIKRDIEALRAETKRDIAEIKRDIEALRAETKQDIAEAKVDFVKWMFRALLGQAAIITAVMAALLKLLV